MVLGLVGTIIVTHHFSTKDFGEYALIFVVVSFISQISTLGLEMSVARFIAGAKDESRKERFLSTSVILRVAAILLASLIAWFGSPLLIALFGQSLLPGFIAYIPLLFALGTLQSLLRSILQGCLLFKWVGFTDLITSISNLILLLLVIYGLNGTIAELFLARSISLLLSSIFAYFAIPIRKKFSFHIDTFKELMKFGMPLQINDILSFFCSRIDTLVVAAFLGPAGIALYEVARKIPDSLRAFYQPFVSVYYPFLAKIYSQEDHVKASKLVNDSTRLVAIITIFGTAIVALFSKEIIRIVFSEKYLPSAPVFLLLMINLSIALISNVMGTSLVSVGDSQKPLIINIFNSFGSWLGCVLLIPPFNIIGAAIATTLGTALTYPPTIYFLQRKIDLKNTSYLKSGVLFCVWSLLVFLIQPVSFLMRIGFLIAFVLASYFLSIITKNDIVLLAEGSGIFSLKPFHKKISEIS
jgi:O-antigen/teichoic acid export membrane protein